MREKPEWWPLCPYPEDIFTMKRAEAIALMPTDPITKTAVAGCLGRLFWTMASDAIWERMQDYMGVEEE
jgi:hypothetical protein